MTRGEIIKVAEDADALTEAATTLGTLQAKLDDAGRQEPVDTQLLADLQQVKACAYRTNSKRLGAVIDRAIATLTDHPAPQAAAPLPLTDEQVGAMWVAARRSSPVPHVVFAKAIEAAHGIGAKP